MLSLKPRPYVQSSFGMQVPQKPYVFLFLLRCRFFRVFFVSFPLYLCMDSTSYVLSFRMAFFYLVTTGWICYISLCENLINQSTNQLRRHKLCSALTYQIPIPPVVWTRYEDQQVMSWWQPATRTKKYSKLRQKSYETQPPENN